jgi:hypothetical protein
MGAKNNSCYVKSVICLANHNSRDIMMLLAIKCLFCVVKISKQ